MRSQCALHKVVEGKAGIMREFCPQYQSHTCISVLEDDHVCQRVGESVVCCVKKYDSREETLEKTIY